MSDQRKVWRYPVGMGTPSGRAAMHFEDPDKNREPSPVALLEERIEVVDDKSAADVIIEGRKKFNELAKRYNADSSRFAEKSKEIEAELRAAKAREDALTARVDTLSRGAPEWKLEDGSLAHVAKRLVAPKGMSRSYFNATVLKPEEMRFLADMSDADRRVLDPYMRVWSRRAKVDEKTAFLIEEFQALNDTLIFADIALAGRGERTPYGRSGTAAQRMQSLPWWPEYQKLAKDVRRAMDTATATEGQEWVPTLMSANLKLLIQAATVVASLFDEITMPTATYDNPVEGADPVVYLIGEATGDAEATNVITADTPKTAKMTLAAKKLALRILLSSEIMEDSIINVASDVLRRIGKAFARGLDEAIINGDTTGTHQDSDVTNAKDRRKAWDGLRKHALVSGMPNVDLATFSTANLLSIRKAMGPYGATPSELVWIVGFKGMVELMKLTEVITMDKYGQNAAVLAGEVARYFGSAVVLSEFIREDLNATAVYDGTTTTKTCLLCVNRSGFARGERRALTINSSDDRHIETDQTVVVGTWRGDFKPWFTTAAAANKIVGIGRNFS